MLEAIITILIMFYIIFNLIVMLGIASQANDNDTKTGSLVALKEFIEELFYDRNYFGILLSAVVFILVIPAMIIIVATQIIFWIGMILGYIYNLGNKKTDRTDILSR